MCNHVIEVRALDVDTPSDPFGAIVDRYEIEAEDSRAAFYAALVLIKARQAIAVFQGSLSQYGRRPLCWTGNWTVSQWEAIHGAHGHDTHNITTKLGMLSWTERST